MYIPLIGDPEMDHQWRDPVRKWNRGQDEYKLANHDLKYINPFRRRGPPTFVLWCYRNNGNICVQLPRTFRESSQWQYMCATATYFQRIVSVAIYVCVTVTYFQRIVSVAIYVCNCHVLSENRHNGRPRSSDSWTCSWSLLRLPLHPPCWTGFRPTPHHDHRGRWPGVERRRVPRQRNVHAQHRQDGFRRNDAELLLRSTGVHTFQSGLTHQ